MIFFLFVIVIGIMMFISGKLVDKISVKIMMLLVLIILVILLYKLV